MSIQWINAHVIGIKQRHDAHFDAPVVPSGPSEAERAFEAAGVAVRMLGYAALVEKLRSA